MNDFLLEKLAASRHREALAAAAERRRVRDLRPPGALDRLLWRVGAGLTRLGRQLEARRRPAPCGACCASA